MKRAVNTRAQSLKAWRVVRSQIGNVDQTITIFKELAFPHPRDAGALATTTWPVGQLADFVLDLEIGSAPLLIREFSNRYEAFIAGVQLTQQLIRIIERNPTAALYIGSALVGASVGTAIARNSEGALVGAGLGILVAALLQSKLAAQEAPPHNATSE